MKKQVKAAGPAVVRQFYVDNSSIFDSMKYDIPRITSILKAAGMKNIEAENKWGWGNQPEVVVFTGNPAVAAKALEKLGGLAKKWGVQIRDRDIDWQEANDERKANDAELDAADDAYTGYASVNKVNTKQLAAAISKHTGKKVTAGDDAFPEVIQKVINAINDLSIPVRAREDGTTDNYGTWYIPLDTRSAGVLPIGHLEMMMKALAPILKNGATRGIGHVSLVTSKPGFSLVVEIKGN